MREIIAVTPEELTKKAIRYCQKHTCALEQETRFGHGVHGSVFACYRATSSVSNALKIHERESPYRRERDVYFRLRDLEITEIEGHQVPILIDWDDDLWAIEMSMVTRPFVLDFGGAYLERPPDFGDEVWDQWERDKEDQFEANWSKAASILACLRNWGIHVADVNPGNIGFPPGESSDS